MEQTNDLLLRTAARLYSIGIEVEAARERLKQLVREGVSYEDARMRLALEEYQTLFSLWSGLETQYLEMKKQLEE